MNIVNKLTLRQMKYNKRRTAVTIIGITLAVAMITAVSAAGSSAMDFLRRAIDSSRVSKYEEMSAVIAGGKLILTIAIMIAAASLIVNGFIISISERTRYLGMFASVGATGKQKRNSVYFEGVIEGVISIPLGVVAGISAMGGILTVLEPTVKRLMETEAELRLVVDMEVIVWAVVFSAVTIIISAYIPAKRASVITPVAAIRQEKDVKIVPGDVKVKGISKKIFGLEGEIALKNIKRNKKRYRVIVFSLFISIVLFITTYSVMALMRADVEYNNRDRGYDIEIVYAVSGDGIEQNKLSYWENFEEITDKMMTSTYATEHMRYLSSEWFQWCFALPMEDNMYAEEYLDCEKVMESAESRELASMVYIIFMPEEELAVYLDSIDIDYEEFTSNKNNVLFYDGCAIRDEEFNNVNIYVGDIYSDKLQNIQVEIQSDVGGGFTEEFKIYSKEEKIMGMCDDVYMLVTPQMAESFLEHDWFCFGNVAYFQTSNDLKFEQEFDEELKKMGCVDEWDSFEFPNLGNYAKERQKYNNIMFLIEISTYSFIALISVLCIANIMNTMSTSMALRRREFAMLKSMGMTDKKFRKMIVCEGMFYGLRAVRCGLPVGIIIDLIIKIVMQPGFGVKAETDIIAYIVVIASAFLVISFTMLYAARKVKKDNIVEALRNENI